MLGACRAYNVEDPASWQNLDVVSRTLKRMRVTVRPHPSGFLLPILRPPASLCCSLVVGQLMHRSITLTWQGSE